MCVALVSGTSSSLSGSHLGAVAARFRYFDEGFKKSSLSNTNLKRELILVIGRKTGYTVGDILNCPPSSRQ